MGIRDGKELLQFLPSATKTGYYLQAEDNIKLKMHTASNKEREKTYHFQTGRMFKDTHQG